MCVAEGSGIVLIEISPGEENVGHIFLLPVLHLAHCCEVHGIISPDQRAVVFLVRLKGAQIALDGIEYL